MLRDPRRRSPRRPLSGPLSRSQSSSCDTSSRSPAGSRRHRCRLATWARGDRLLSRSSRDPRDGRPDTARNRVARYARDASSTHCRIHDHDDCRAPHRVSTSLLRSRAARSMSCHRRREHRTRDACTGAMDDQASGSSSDRIRSLALEPRGDRLNDGFEVHCVRVKSLRRKGPANSKKEKKRW